MIESTSTLAPLVTDAASLLVGPPGGLPAPVPDFVGDLLGGIGSFVNGSLEHLGDAVRAVTPGGPETAPGR